MSGKQTLDAGQRVSAPTVYAVNIPLLVGTMLALSVLTVASYFWHGFQLHRLAASLLDRAGQLEQESKWHSAAEYIHRYLQLRPEDQMVNIRLARTYDKSIETGSSVTRAIDLYYRAVGVAQVDEQQQLRHRLTELLLQVGRFAEAETEAAALLSQDDANPFARRALAMALFGRFRSGQLQARSSAAPSGKQAASDSGTGAPLTGQAESGPGEAGTGTSEAEAGPGRNLGDALERAIAVNQDQVDLAVSFAAILREAPQFLSDAQRSRYASNAERQQAADQTVDQAVSKADTAEALLTRFLYCKTYKLLGGEQDLVEAFRRDPENPRILLIYATHEHEKAEAARPRNASPEELAALYAEAEQKYRQGIAVAPSDVDLRLGLAEVLRVRGELAEGIRVLREGLEVRGQFDLRMALRSAELMILDDQLDAAREVLDRFDAEFAGQAARQRPAVRRSIEGQRRWLEANWLLHNDQAVQAIAWVRPTTSSESPLVRFRAWYTLGQCYSAVAQRDRAAEAFTQAASLQPDSLEPRLAAANEWMASGQPGQAIPHLLHALNIVNSPDIRATLASAYLQAQLALLPDQRDWLAFEAQMSLLEDPRNSEQMKQPWLVTLLRVERSLADDASDDHAASVALLNGLEEKYPEDSDLFERLVLRYESLGATPHADRALAAYGRLVNRPAAFHFLQAQVLSRRQQYEEALNLLEQDRPEHPQPDRDLIERGRVQTLLAAGRWEDAREQLVRQHQRQPNNPLIMLRLGELLLQNQDFAGGAQWEQRLRQCEGEDGSYWRYLKILRLLDEEAGDARGDERVDEARKVQRELKGLRPAWSKTLVVEGLIEERRGRARQAIDAYSQAIRLGERNPTLYQRLSLLLYREGRLAEAQEILDVLEQNRVPQSDGLAELAVTLATRQGNLEEAIQLAKRRTEDHADEVTGWLRYGQVLLQARRTSEAEAALQQAAQLQPDDVTTWIAQFALYARTDQPDAARDLIPRLRDQVKLPAADRHFVLAQAFESLGDRVQARENYEQAARLNDKDVNILTRVSQFFRDEDPAAAEQALRRVLEIDPNNHSARRTLAVMLARRGAFEEVARLLENNALDDTESLVDSRLRVALLLQQDPPELDKAEQLLQSLIQKLGTPADVDRLLMAQIYLKQREATENPNEKAIKFKLAQREFTALCARQNAVPDHLRLYIGLLLNEQLWSDAESWLRELETIAPDELSTITLRCQWLQRQQRDAEVGPLVEKFAERYLAASTDEENRNRRLAALGGMLSGAQLDALAEVWLRRAAEADPRYFDDLVSCYLRQEKSREAVQLCLDETKRDGSAARARTLANVLAMTDEDVQVAEQTLSEAVQKHPRDAELLSAVASLRVLRQGQMAEAIAMYRKSLEIDPSNILTLNNLAVILAEEGMHEEGLAFIDQAIALAGGQATLLDTKGMVQLHAGRLSQATDLFQRATAQQPGDPLFHFHLAVALMRRGEAADARQTLDLAMQRDLLAKPLTPTDRRLLAELQASLSP